MSDFSAGFNAGQGAGLLQDIQSRRQMKVAMRNANIREYEAVQSAKNAQGHLAIAQQDLGIRLQDAAARAYDVKRKQGIEQGLSEAMQQGGYPAAIDYLKVADPYQALQFHAKKLELDDQILKNDVLQTVAPLEKDKAMLEAYGQLGKMASGIENMEPAARDKAWKMVLPMVKTIWPDAPTEYNSDAQTAGQLFMAQGTPTSALAFSQQGTMKAQSTIGKLNNDLEIALKSGHAPDSPKVKSLQTEIGYQQQKAEKMSLQTAQINLQQAKTKFEATRAIQKDLASYSKSFTDKLEPLGTIKTYVDILKNDPTNGTVLTQLRQNVARLTEKGVMTDNDIERMTAAAGYRAASKSITAYLKGEKVALDSQEVIQITAMVEAQARHLYEQQLSRESQFGEMIGESELVDYKTIPKPSKLYEKMFSTKKADTQYLQAAEQIQDPAMKANVMEAIKMIQDNPDAYKPDALEQVMSKVKQQVDSQNGAQQQ